MLRVHLDQAAQQRAAMTATLKDSNHKVSSPRDLNEIFL